MMIRNVGLSLLTVFALLVEILTLQAAEPEVRDLGQKLELFVDSHGIESLNTARLVLHEPRPAEIAIKFDQPWEGEASAYVTVFKDTDRFRMYYRGWADSTDNGAQVTCYAESPDGITWTKPKLGLFAFKGSTENNIIWQDPAAAAHNFTAFKDARPDVPADERYKAVSTLGKMKKKGLYAFASPDGVHWRIWREEPVITKGAFDSQNLVYWDASNKQYRSYYRIFINGVRAIALATSDDFIHWTDPQPIDLGNAAVEHFYTNAIAPYFREPSYFFSFPKRFEPKRKRLDEHNKIGISDAVFLSSRDGTHFDRQFTQAFIRPGRDRYNWGDRSVMTAWGLMPTEPDEMSVYYSQNYHFPNHHLRRGVLRLDGIGSVQATGEPGEVTTKPFRFAGRKLMLNYSTSAAGSVQIEVQDPAGKPISGFALVDAKPLYGDEIAEAYSWASGDDVSSLAGKPVRLRIVLKDGDLYSYRFVE